MIFVTVGTQEPFDRMLKVVDQIANECKEKKFIAQTNNSEYNFKYMQTVSSLAPEEFNKLFSEAELVISHAGIGTIISALMQNKPIVVFPRLTKYHEHRNEHQLATAKKFQDLGYINVAFNESELKEKAINIIKNNKQAPSKSIGLFASATLIESIRNFISE